MTAFNTEKITQESGETVKEKTEYPISNNQTIELEIPTLEDVGHPLVPEVNDNYKLREINSVFDLELLSYVINDPDYFAMIEGEAATGKNMSIKEVASVSNWPMLRVNFSIGTTYQSLVGRYAPAESESIVEEAIERDKAVKNTADRILEEHPDVPWDNAIQRAERILPESSSFRWVDGLLTRAVKNGWMFVADEINAADEEAIMPLNGLTEDRESRYLTIEEKSEVIEPHPRFRFIATRNPISYSGVSEMNSALESRAYVIPYGYHETGALKEIIKENSNILENESEHNLNELVSLAQDIRTFEQEGNDYVTKISTRDLIKTARLTDIMNIREAATTVFIGIADPTDEDSIKEMIRTQGFK